MKKYINKLAALLTMVMFAASCDSDAPLTVLQSVSFPAPITSSANTFVLTEATADNDAVTISWPAVVFPVAAPVLYTVQFDLTANTKGKNAWVNVQAVEAGNDVLSKTFTVRELNKIAADLGLKADVAGAISARVVAVMDRSIYSNPVDLTVTPYEKAIVFGEIYMPGSYQGKDWDVNTATILTAIEKGIYQGYVTVLPGYGTGFKVNTAKGWDEFYGAGAAAGSLARMSTTDLQLPGEGSFQVKVNLNTLKYTATAYEWGIAGDATHAPTAEDANFGWNNALPMSYDHQTKTWKITAALIPGNIKFKLNNQWTINYGPNDGSGTVATYDGGAYYISEAGTYEVTFTVNETAGVATDKGTYPTTASFTVAKK
jgi:hypothetical protein